LRHRTDSKSRVSENAAKRKTAEHGRAAEHEYRNQAGELVRWSFKQVERVCEIEEGVPKNGTELFSRFFKEFEVKSLLTQFED